MTADVVADPLPTADDVRGLLNGLFDRAVTVEQQDKPVLRGRDVHVVGSYVDDDGALRAVVFCDLVTGNVLGAALALVPPPRVQEALDAGTVLGDLADNTREVLNVGASMFNQGGAHLKLAGTWVVPEEVPGEVVDFLREPCRRSDLTVEVPGYGKGVIALLLR